VVFTIGTAVEMMYHFDRSFYVRPWWTIRLMEELAIHIDFARLVEN